ncbi:MAG: GNAT family N-acetyltransferase [Oscillospiraceae bacterium]
MNDFTIRKATPLDIEAILNLIYAIAQYEKMTDEVVATQESLQNALFGEGSAQCLMAEENGKLVGYALYFYNFSTFVGTKGLYLEDLFLYPETRKKGYGKKLMHALFQIAKEENCGRMEWCCLNWNTQSQGFYKSLGAKPMSEWTTWRLDKKDIIALCENN